jgi:hypothetical protein
MAEKTDFIDILYDSLNNKQEWFNKERLPQMLEAYRLVFTCVKNLNELFVEKSLIEADPYKLDRRISDIVVPDTTIFPEPETAVVLGTRLSEYETMLDFICTYLVFSVENISFSRIKLLMEFNAVFSWENLVLNSQSPNTRALAAVVMNAKNSTNNVTISMINDSVEKSASALANINLILKELADFQKELYKGKLRKDILSHPEFDVEKANSSPENELSEIKRVYVKVFGKKHFISEYVAEIISEDQGSQKERRRELLLKKLSIKSKTAKKENKLVDIHSLLMNAILALGGISPILEQLHSKLSENFDLLFAKKKSFFNTLVSLLHRMFGLPEKEKSCLISVKNPKSGLVEQKKINVNSMLTDLEKKSHLYNLISSKGPEYKKIESASEDTALIFLNKQISECQQFFSLITALDEHFKKYVDIMNRNKIKGLKIDLTSLRNAIIAVNKKRGDYISNKEEIEQMKKLGIQDDE